MVKRVVATVMIASLSGCAATVAGGKLPGTRDPHTEQTRLLTEAIQKQSEAIIAIASMVLKATPTPTATPETR